VLDVSAAEEGYVADFASHPDLWTRSSLSTYAAYGTEPGRNSRVQRGGKVISAQGLADRYDSVGYVAGIGVPSERRPRIAPVPYHLSSAVIRGSSFSAQRSPHGSLPVPAERQAISKVTVAAGSRLPGHHGTTLRPRPPWLGLSFSAYIEQPRLGGNGATFIVA
jgi:hypothetical protein